ncbi:MAG TPA: hypothetical protein VK254_00310 [Candidatus Bathyarchaeia archaeon]|nr:hypothetical protein [Candidatus Bathyarchaeia archaeon]
MSVPKVKKPTLTVICIYTLGVLNEIKLGKKISHNEWEYLTNNPIPLLDELLSYDGFGFDPPPGTAAGNGNGKSLLEQSWQFGRVYDALKEMQVISTSQNASERKRQITGALSSFKNLVKEILAKGYYNALEDQSKEVLEQCRQFFYVLHGILMRTHTGEMKNLIAAA